MDKWHEGARFCAVLALVSACGASPRMMQQSASYYEHCQSAELNPIRTVDERRECWVAWLEYYTLGQPLERVSYAQERRIALAHGEEIDPLPDRVDRGLELASSVEAESPMGTVPEDAEVGAVEDHDPEDPDAIAAPEVFRQDEGAPPGRHFPVRQVAPPSEAPVPGPPSAVGDGPCGPACNPTWYRCAGRCDGRAGTCLDACASHYRQCMGACN